MLLRKLLTLVVLALLAVILIELTYRVYLFGAAGLTIEKVNSVHPLSLSGLIQPSRYSGVVYELKPGLDTWFKLARFRTNSVGLPDREYSLSKPENTFRIVVIGSSFSMAAGVAMEDSWQDVLERDLNARVEGIKVEVINFSVGGYDPRQLLATLTQRGVLYAPDLALVDLTLTSPSLMREDEAYHRPFAPPTPTYPFLHSFAFERLSQRTIPPSTPVPSAEQTRAFEQVLAGFRSFGEQSRLPICFVILHHNPQQLAEAFKLCQQVGRFSSCVINTTPAFQNEKFSNLVILKIDWHPNPRAQKIFARVVFDHLITNELKPANQ
jgi:hypothetical protein